MRAFNRLISADGAPDLSLPVYLTDALGAAPVEITGLAVSGDNLDIPGASSLVDLASLLDDAVPLVAETQYSQTPEQFTGADYSEDIDVSGGRSASDAYNSSVVITNLAIEPGSGGVALADDGADVLSSVNLPSLPAIADDDFALFLGDRPFAPNFEASAQGSAQAGVQADAGPLITAIPSLDFAAKGGIKGKPDKGDDTGDDGGTGDTGVLSEYLSGAGDGTAGYDILIDFKGSDWTIELQQAFINTADYLTSVITDDIGGGGRYRGTIIDDLYISAELTAIDGEGGILGQAGPTAVWTANDLTATGIMQFDTADAGVIFGSGLWDDVVNHEMMHVLGFGSLWEYGSHDLVNNFQYTGTEGVTAYSAFTGETEAFIPVEDQFGPGTEGSHWDEAALDNELMTGLSTKPITSCRSSA